ncbi:intein-containing DNA polymerase II [Halorubrum lipolyticum]|uniref:DNA polymerase n=1 Tax=Halorubrum lipolyticum DSM 21995 TaxID=1227482 RepID=M0NV88_9EURY|nr:intein-containing DNA polymerase II [Halorubrum lipolyticum]EMA61169.1 DNA polymerase B elongation subunit [Halorubrum lipolyticum DSM 21995]
MTQSGLSDFSSSGDAGDGSEDGTEAEREELAAQEAAVVAGGGRGHVSDVVDVDEAKFPESTGTVELMITQIDYAVEGYGSDEYPVVHVFGRRPAENVGGDGEEDTVEHLRVLGVEPYFYVPTADLDRDPVEEYDVVIGTREENVDGEPYESIRGEALTRIVTRTPRDVGNIRDDFATSFEADILFPNRFLIDNGLNGGLRVEERRLDDGEGTIQVHEGMLEPAAVDAEMRVNTFDIEVDDRRGFPEDGEEPIICLTSHDSYDDEYVVWLYDAPEAEVPPPEDLPDYEGIVGDGEELEFRVETFEAEAAMLDAFIEYIDDTDPDLLTGWNFEDFDAPYVLDRLEVLDDGSQYDLSVDRLSRIGEVWRSGWGGPDIKGRVVFDLLYAYKRTMFTELESYRLDAVGERELGVGKERYTGDIGDLWEQDPERLLEYSIRDVELCVEIDRKQDVIAFWDEVRTFVGCKIEDAPTPGDTVDMYVLHKAFGKFALPTKGQQESEDFEGGAVFDPITGVKEMVTVQDLKSLYPMCMVTINAGPETKVDPDQYDGETYVAPNGTHFRKEPDGIMREMVDELLSEREEKKSLRNDHDPGTEPYEQYDRQQASVKVIMNCFTPDTEVVTPDGVRSITELEVGDAVYSLDPETEEMAVKTVEETHAYPDYRGDLVDIETSKIDFRVTPNHRMLVRKNETNGITEDGYGFVEAGDLDGATNYELPHDWDGPDGERVKEVDLTELVDGEYEVWVRPSVHGHTFTAELGWTPRRVPKADVGETGYVFTAAEFEEHREYVESVCERSYVHREPGRKWIPRTFDGDDFLELLAWYVTEGNVYTSEEKRFGDNLRGSATTIQIAQDAVADGGDSDHETIGDLLDRMRLDYYVDDRSYQFTSELLGDFLRDRCGDGSFEKRLPDRVFEATRAQKRAFLETLIDGDGDRQTGSWRYTTSSEELRDDVLRLCAHLGLTASYNRDSGSWRIYVTEDGKNTLRMHRSGSRSEAEDGVYCVTVEDNHTLLAGRNGKFQFVGQSLYGVTGWDRFRLYDKEGAAAVTATGREVIDFTEEAAEELNYQVAYGDTDSVMLSLSDMSKEKAIETSFEIEDHINERYDDFARDELNAEFHRFQIEFEKLYRRFFQAGKKKRYAGHIIWKEGKDVDDIDITGFEYKRSDIAGITKEVQQNVIETIVTGDDIDEDLEEVKAYLVDVIARVLDGDMDLDEIGIPGGIGKKLDAYDTPTAQVRGAKYANLMLGTNFGSGSKPKRLYIEKVHPDFWQRMEDEEGLDPQRDHLYGEFKRDPDVICFEYADQVPDEFEVDWEKMLDKTLQGPIERVIEALGMSWEEVKTGQEQTGLGSFM